MMTSVLTTLAFLMITVVSSEQNEFRQHLRRRLPITCDPECDATSDEPHCYVIDGYAQCGCISDADCADFQICMDAMRSCDSSTDPPTCAKLCGCRFGTTDGCDPNSDRPFCSEAYTMTGTACMCMNDTDCINGGTCGRPSCVPDIHNYCSNITHDVDWGCSSTTTYSTLI